MASDLNQVMADFAANGNGYEDEDELMAELNAMVAEGDGPATAGATNMSPSASRGGASARTETRAVGGRGGGASTDAGGAVARQRQGQDDRAGGAARARGVAS